MGCTVSVQIHPDTTIKEDPPGINQEAEATEATGATEIPLVRKDSSDSYITINLDDDSKVYI